jgi:plasmid stability protein
MEVQTKRSTIYLDPDLHRALKLKSATTNRSISDIVNESLRISLREDEEDIRAFKERANEPNIPFDEFLARLKADGKI